MNKLIRLLIIQLVILYSCNILAQSYGRVYNIIGGNEYIFELLFKDNKFFLLCKGIWDPQNQVSKYCDYITILDKNRDIKYTKYYLNSNWLAAHGALLDINDTLYVLGYNAWDTLGRWQVYKTNLQGDSIDYFTFHFPIQTYARGMLTKDDYLYILGNTFVFNDKNDAEMVVIKSDKKGKIIKEERFKDVALPGNDISVHGVARSPDGNFVAVFTALNHDGFRAILFKFDEDLNVLWQRVFNTCSDFYNYPDVTVGKNGNIFLTWSLDTETMLDKGEIGWAKFRKYSTWPVTLYGLTGDGDIMWSDTLWTLRSKGKTFGPQYNTFKLKEAKNGDYLAAGLYHELKDRKAWALLMRYSPEGKLLWQKIYEDKNFDCKYNDFFDIQEEDNGDIICGGELWDRNGEWNNAEHMWLIRVDSMGCFEPGCGTKDTLHLILTESDYVTSTGEVIKDYSYDEGIVVFPNPASTYINVELPGIAKATEWNIIDTQGNKIAKGKAENISHIDISELKPGVYFMQVINEKKKSAVCKFVVEHTGK